MLETVLAILAAVIVTFVAGLLVRRQNKYHEATEELINKVEDDLGEAVNEFESLTGEELTEYSLTHLENSIKALNERLCCVKKQHRQLERSTRYVKRKKNFADD